MAKQEYILSLIDYGREVTERISLDSEDLSDSFMEWFANHFANQDGEKLDCGCRQYIMGEEEITIISAREAETGMSVRQTLIDELDLDVDVDGGGAIVDEIAVGAWFDNGETCRRYCDICRDHHESESH